ncbi:hypothetical protein, partial [Nocardia cyriacigeorgica]|uniref:hypothetical protein n=1 Tax=Nocardia cyriacigeorgica TaxID=135487 RepID=UPI0024570C5A
VLHDSGVKIDVSDMDAAAQVQRATSFGSDGMNSVSGDVTGAGAVRVALWGGGRAVPARGRRGGSAGQRRVTG